MVSLRLMIEFSTRSLFPLRQLRSNTDRVNTSNGKLALPAPACQGRQMGGSYVGQAYAGAALPVFILSVC